MLLTSIYLLTLTSLALASPLESRRQPSAPCNQDCNEDGTSCPIGCPITPPNPTPTPITCEQYCRTDDIDYSACISSCQIIDGVPQTSESPVIFPQNLNQMEKVCEEQCGGRKDFDPCMEHCSKHKFVAESMSKRENNAIMKRVDVLPIPKKEMFSNPESHKEGSERKLSRRGSDALMKRIYKYKKGDRYHTYYTGNEKA